MPFDLDAPVAGAFAGGFVGQALGRFQDVDGGALGGKSLGDGPGDGAAYFLVAVEQQHDFAMKEAGLGEHLDGGEGHGHAGFHVQDARAPEAAFGGAAGHGFEGAEGPDRIQMAKQEDRLGGAGFGFGAEAGFEDIAERALAVELDAASESFGMGGGEGNTGIDGGFVVGGRLGQHQLANEVEQARAACGGLRPAGRAWGWGRRNGGHADLSGSGGARGPLGNP